MIQRAKRQMQNLSYPLFLRTFYACFSFRNTLRAEYRRCEAGLPLLKRPTDLMESIAKSVRKSLWNTTATPLRARLARGAFWAVFDASFTRCFALLMSIVVARLVGRELFGEFGVVQGTVGVFALLAGLGMSVTATKYVAELRQKDPVRVGRIIGLSVLVATLSAVIMSIALIATAPWLARTTF